MTSYTVTTAKHATLTANTVDTVTLGTQTAWNAPKVEVLNRGTSDPIAFTTDGSTPTVLGDNCYIVPAGGALRVDLPLGATDAVQLIAASAVPYSVTRPG